MSAITEHARLVADRSPLVAPSRATGRPSVDIQNRQDIEELLLCFYTQAFVDPLIGPVFTAVAQLDLQAHLPNVADFWEMALLHTGHYRRNAFVRHQALHRQHPLSPDYFARWLGIWTSTVDSRFAGAVAERAKTQGARIAHSMARRLNT